MEGKFWKIMEGIADIFILNTLFLLSCLPVFTVGAAFVALYETWFQIRAKTNSTLLRTYWAAFLHNVKQASFLWILYVFLAVDAGLILWSLGEGEILFLIKTSRACQVILAVFVLIYVFTLVYIFPIAAYFRCSAKQCLIDAAGLSFRHLPETAYILFIWIFTVILIRFVPFLLMLLPALACRLTAEVTGRLFQLHTVEGNGD